MHTRLCKTSGISLVESVLSFVYLIVTRRRFGKFCFIRKEGTRGSLRESEIVAESQI